MKSEQLINDFNDGEYENGVKPFFGNVVTFLKFANKHGFIDELLLENIPYYEFKESLEYLDTLDKTDNLDYNEIPEEFKNSLLLYKLEKDSEKTLTFITDDIISDVYPMNGGYYIFIKDREELADLFESGYRDSGPREYAKAVLGEDSWEPHWDTTNDVYGDVIEELNDKNKSILAEYIIKNIGGQEFSLDDYHDGLFKDISDEQGTEGTFQITNDNVMVLIGDRDAMKEMLKGELSDLKSELYSIHNNAYNSAYESELYDDVWNELSTYFEPKSWETVKKTRYDGNTYYEEYLKINNFHQIIYDFLVENEGGTYNESFLEYWGSLVGVITSLMNDNVYEWLDFRVPDYADWSLTKKYINEIFPDYI
jgi:hypothetical protein